MVKASVFIFNKFLLYINSCIISSMCCSLIGFWGRWRLVVLCIVGIEIGERLAFYGISANLVTYLTHVLHEGTEVSATNVNNWIGATFIAPLLGAFLADAFWGRFWTILIFGTVYFVVSAQSSSPFTQLVRSMKSHYWRQRNRPTRKFESLWNNCWVLFLSPAFEKWLIPFNVPPQSLLSAGYVDLNRAAGFRTGRCWKEDKFKYQLVLSMNV